MCQKEEILRIFFEEIPVFWRYKKNKKNVFEPPEIGDFEEILEILLFGDKKKKNVFELSR